MASNIISLMHQNRTEQCVCYECIIQKYKLRFLEEVFETTFVLNSRKEKRGKSIRILQKSNLPQCRKVILHYNCYSLRAVLITLKDVWKRLSQDVVIAQQGSCLTSYHINTPCVVTDGCLSAHVSSILSIAGCWCLHQGVMRDINATPV